MGTGFLPFLYRSPASSDTRSFFTRMTTTPSGINVKAPIFWITAANLDAMSTRPRASGIAVKVDSEEYPNGRFYMVSQAMHRPNQKEK